MEGRIVLEILEVLSNFRIQLIYVIASWYGEVGKIRILISKFYLWTK